MSGLGRRQWPSSDLKARERVLPRAVQSVPQSHSTGYCKRPFDVLARCAGQVFDTEGTFSNRGAAPGSSLEFDGNGGILGGPKDVAVDGSFLGMVSQKDVDPTGRYVSNPNRFPQHFELARTRRNQLLNMPISKKGFKHFDPREIAGQVHVKIPVQ